MKRNAWNTGWWRSPARPSYDKAFIPLGTKKATKRQHPEETGHQTTQRGNQSQKSVNVRDNGSHRKSSEHQLLAKSKLPATYVTLGDDEVYSILFPGRGEWESVYKQPDWARVHRELACVGVILRILHGCVCSIEVRCI